MLRVVLQLFIVGLRKNEERNTNNNEGDNNTRNKDERKKNVQYFERMSMPIKKNYFNIIFHAQTMYRKMLSIFQMRRTNLLKYTTFIRMMKS